MAVTKLPIAALHRDDGNVRRTYAITPDQDRWIRERARRTGNPWAHVVRNLLAAAIAAEEKKDGRK